MSQNSSEDQLFVKRIAIGIALPTAALLIVAFLKQNYGQDDVMRVLSYFNSDRPPLPFREITESWGNHYFGDYAMNYWFTRSSTFSIDLMYGTPWFPSAFIFLLPFTFFEYATGLVLFLISGCIGLLASGMHSLRSFSVSEKILFVCLVLMGCGPVISAFDRGNEVIYLVPLTYVYLIAVSKNSTFSIYATLALIVGLKPHMIFLIVLLPLGPKLLPRYFKAAASVIGFQLFGLMFTNSNPVSRVQAILESADRVASESVYLNSRSFGSMITGLSSLTSFGDQIGSWAFENRNFISISSVLIVMSLFFILRKGLPLEIQALMICGLVIFALPFSPPYNSVIILPVLLLRFYNSRYKTESGKQETSWDHIFVLVVACHILPIPFIYLDGVSLSALLSPISYLLLVGYVVARQAKVFTFHKIRIASIGVFMTTGVILLSAGLFSSHNDEKILLNSGNSSMPRDFGPMSSLCSFIGEGKGSIKIGFQGLQNKSDSIQSLFQTSETMNGIWIERALDGQVSLFIADSKGLIVGTSVPIERNAQRLKGVATIQSDGRYSLEVNGLKSSGTTPFLDPSCSNLSAGKGFNKDQNWIGESQITVMSVRDFAWRDKLSTLQMIWISLLILNIPQMTTGLSRKQFQQN